MRNLAGFATATVHESCAASRILPIELRPVWAEARLLGPAFTVRQPLGHNDWLHHSIYAAPPGSVLVCAAEDPRFGYWGELMTRAARQRSITGLVIMGGVRDVTALEAVGFPVFASAICMRGTSKSASAGGHLGRDIAMGDVVVSSGEIVMGDRDGVVVLPARGLAEVLSRAQERELREADIRRAVADGARLIDLVTPSTESNGPSKRGVPAVTGGSAADIIARLRRLDSCCVSDALDRLSMEGALAGFRRWGPRGVLVGPVRTVLLAQGPAPVGARHLGTRTLDVAGRDDIVLVANAGRCEAGAWGGLLSLAARHRGLAGVIVDGALRDGDEVDAGPLPVFARAATPRTARDRYHEVGCDVPVTVESVRVQPGDIVMADGSGVVFIPIDDVARVIAIAEEIAEEEARMASALASGGHGTDVLDERYERLVRRDER
jgi:regulator of RNase E activity RraA